MLFIQQSNMDSYLNKYFLDTCDDKYDFMIYTFKHSLDLFEQFIQLFKIELQINDKRKRCKAVSMFGKLFSMGPVNLAVKEPDIWKLYLERFSDRWVEVRKECLKMSADIALRWPQLFQDLIPRIVELQADDSSRIRLQVVTTLERIAIENYDVVESNELFWEVLNIRTDDVSLNVRIKADNTLIRIRNNHCNDAIKSPFTGAN